MCASGHQLPGFPPGGGPRPPDMLALCSYAMFSGPLSGELPWEAACEVERCEVRRSSVYSHAAPGRGRAQGSSSARS